MARDDPQVNLRLPAELKSSLEGAADASGRSVTAEVISRLQASFAERQADEMLKEALARLGRIESAVIKQGHSTKPARSRAK